MSVALSDDSALVLLSGGQDSTVCLAWALERYARVETVGFEYGQRHSVELSCRANILERIGALKLAWQERLGDAHLMKTDVFNQIGGTALTSDMTIKMGEAGLPNTFVPGRNLVFLTTAAALAYRRGIRHLVGGMCETDFSGYPDCRDATLKALNSALNLGMEAEFEIQTPLMWLTKAETFHLARELGGDPLVDLILTETHTCYLGDRTKLHAWGYGCGACPACELRRAGWEAFLEMPSSS